MVISELRTRFRNESGFSYFLDTKVDEVLNNGIKYLDSITFSPVKDQRIFIPLKSEDNCISFPMKCRVIKEVWACDDSRRERVNRDPDLDGLRNATNWLFKYWWWWRYYGSTFSVVANGRPHWYRSFVTEPFDKSIAAQSYLSKFADVTWSDGVSRGIAFAPRADKDYIIEVFGKFDSIPLSDTTVTNWWSENYPLLVVQAAMYVLDMSYRNSSGGMELKGVIVDAVSGINNDAIEEEIGSDDCIMEG